MTHETETPEQSAKKAFRPPDDAAQGAGRTGFDRRMTVALVALSIAQFLVALDFSIIYVALPSIGSGLSLPADRLQWVVSGYSVFFASFLVVGGRAADLTGPRRLFLAALGVFGLGSLAGGLSGSLWVLVVARAAQGIAAAALTPSMLALVSASFPAGALRSRALSIWGAIGAVGLAAGVLIGGALTAVLSWRWVFFVNVPLVVLTVLLALRALPVGQRTANSVRGLNIPGAALFTSAILSAVLAMTEAAAVGWTASATLSFIAAFVLLSVVWLLHDRRSATPLISPALLRIRSLLGGSLMSAMYMASVGAEFFLITLFLQDQRGYGPLAAGMAFLPLALSVVAGNLVTGRLNGPLGIRGTLSLAFVIGALGLALLAVGVHVDAYLLGVLPGLIVSGLGQGMAFAGMYIAGTKDVDDSAQGTASAILTTTQYTGGAFGLAILVLILGKSPSEGTFASAYTVTVVIAAVAAVCALITLKGNAGAGKGGEG